MFTSLLNKELSIWTNTVSGDAYGAVTNTYAQSSSGIPCVLTPINGRTFTGAGSVLEGVEYKVVMSYIAGITVKDRVEVDSVTYEIVAAYDAGGRGVATLLFLKKA